MLASVEPHFVLLSDAIRFSLDHDAFRASESIFSQAFRGPEFALSELFFKRMLRKHSASIMLIVRAPIVVIPIGRIIKLRLFSGRFESKCKTSFT